MKRLLAQIGITYFSVLAVAFYLSQKAVLAFAVASAAGMLLLLIVPKTRRTVYLPVMAFAALAACLVNLGFTYLVAEPTVATYSGEKREVTATLKDEPYRSYTKYCYRLSAVSVDGKAARFDLLLQFPEKLDIEVDDTLRFTSDIEEEKNDYYLSQGYLLRSGKPTAQPAVIKAEKHGLYYNAVRLREYLREAPDSLLPKDCAALCKAVFIGDKYALELSIREEFRYAGASYFIVVSGMHFAVICMFLLRLTKKLNRWVQLCVMLFAIVLYAAVTGFQPSVLRSGLMMTLTVVGMTVRRQAYPLNHLGFAGLVLPLIMSPYGIGQIGLILSFYATLAILLWANPIMDKLSVKDPYGVAYRFDVAGWLRRKAAGSPPNKAADRRKVKRGVKLFFIRLYNLIAAMLSVSLAANILVFPITVFLFREVSLVTLLSSLLLYWAIYMILLLTFAVCVLWYLGPLSGVAVALSWPLYALCRYVLWAVESLSGLPFAFVTVRSPYIHLWLIFSLTLGAVVLLYRNRYRLLPSAALGSVMILLAGMVTHSLVGADTPVLEVYTQVGGYCVGVSSDDDFHLLEIDAYGNALYDLLDRLGQRYGGAETAFCADYDAFEQYYNYVEGKFAISRYLLYDKNGYTNGGQKIVGFRNDCTFVLNEELMIQTAVSDGKTVIMITAGDRKILLLPEGCTVDNVPESMRRADIILMRRYFIGAEKLRCRELILCGTDDNVWMTADVMRPCYERVYLACEGDIALSLGETR